MNDLTLHIVSKFYSYYVFLRSILSSAIDEIDWLNLTIRKYFFSLLIWGKVLFVKKIGLDKCMPNFFLGAIFLFSSSFLTPIKTNHSFISYNSFYKDGVSVIHETVDISFSGYYLNDNFPSLSNKESNFYNNFLGYYEDRINYSSTSGSNLDKNLLFSTPMEILINTLATGASGLVISLPLRGRANVSIDWGDGSNDTIAVDNLLTNVEHTYASHGEYIIKINGVLDQFGAGSSGYPNSNKIIEIISFGDLGITRLSGAFHSASNLGKVPNIIPAGIIDMSWMFYGAKIFNSEIGAWDVRDVTDMSYMFSEASLFNQDIKNWNVEKVTNMERMFKNASSFNQSLG
ncbi:BspA family leucine-rich repeat surface protein [uncultured Algoriphagus sp.]|uniref:BspA family leucine-rich repeat surface protein n=1 Tax=uncultured Algoriphagus sp. TaxID=417365 RepID=UPI00259A9533|nr:BspA family leucine-rich repeat surface protein [uncultured Algoriphagus sp.]